MKSAGISKKVLNDLKVVKWAQSAEISEKCENQWNSTQFLLEITVFPAFQYFWYKMNTECKTFVSLKRILLFVKESWITFISSDFYAKTLFDVRNIENHWKCKNLYISNRNWVEFYLFSHFPLILEFFTNSTFCSFHTFYNF